MARLSGLSKQIADMALLLMKEGTDPDVALNSAARLSDATPEQVAFADDLIKRRETAYRNAQDLNKNTIMRDFDIDQARVFIQAHKYSPAVGLSYKSSLNRLNKSLPSGTTLVPEGERPPLRLTRTPRNLAYGRITGIHAAENRLRTEIALAAAEGNPERLQVILRNLGYHPDTAYNIAIRALGL